MRNRDEVYWARFVNWCKAHNEIALNRAQPVVKRKVPNTRYISTPDDVPIGPVWTKLQVRYRDRWVATWLGVTMEIGLMLQGKEYYLYMNNQQIAAGLTFEEAQAKANAVFYLLDKFDTENDAKK